MKQTVEEAAQSMAYNKMPDWGGLPALAKKYFIKGADWQARQSPWISVEERLPEKPKYDWVLAFCYFFVVTAIVVIVIPIAPFKIFNKIILSVFVFVIDAIELFWIGIFNK